MDRTALLQTHLDRMVTHGLLAREEADEVIDLWRRGDHAKRAALCAALLVLLRRRLGDTNKSPYN